MDGAVVEPKRVTPPEVARLYPYEPRFVDLPGDVAMAVVDEGPRDAAETVVLLHGNPTWGFLYRKVAPGLLTAGARVVIPDHVGCGRSAKPLDPKYYSLDRHADNLERALDAIGARDVTLVVQDWGGPIGLAWAVRNPERVKRLVVLNTLVFPPRKKRPLSPFHALFASRLGRPLGQNLNLFLEASMRLGVHRRLPRDVLDAYRWPFPTAASRVGLLRFVRMVPDSPDHPTAAGLRAIEEGMPKLASKPAAIVWGDRDPVFRPRGVEQWTRRLTDVRSVDHLPDASHFLQEDRPDAIVRAVGALLRS